MRASRPFWERAMRWIAAAMVVLTVAACGGVSAQRASDDEQKQLIQTATTTSPKLQAGDKIRVTVFGEDRLSGEFEIDQAGLVSLPLAGTLKAAGLSKQEMERELARKFRGEYLRVARDRARRRLDLSGAPHERADPASGREGLQGVSAVADHSGAARRSGARAGAVFLSDGVPAPSVVRQPLLPS
jgi:hypothetical protein